MDISNKPLYMENRNYGEVYQVLDVIKRTSEILNNCGFDIDSEEYGEE